MAVGLFNVAKGKIAHYATLPAAADAFVVVLLSAAEADDVLNNYDDLAAIKAVAGNVEATFTGYARHVTTAVTLTIDDTANNAKVDITTDPSWSPTSAQALVKLLICYRPDTASVDGAIVPMFHDDFALTTPTSGTVTYTVATGGFYTAS